MKRVYFDTNQLYYIRIMADEAGGFDYGDYQWAYRVFSNDPILVGDIRALCYIVAFQYEWELDFLPSNASYTELVLSSGERAVATQEAWRVFAEGLKEEYQLRPVPFEPKCRARGRLNLTFVKDAADRIIIRDAIAWEADVLLTCDNKHILPHQTRLRELGITVMRPSVWLNKFLGNVKTADEDAVDWVERVLFCVGKGA